MTILFSTSRGWLPWLIRLLTRSAVSHCGIGVTWLGVPVVIHADVGGVLVVPRIRWLESNTLVEEVVAPCGGDGVALVEERLGRAVSMLHLPYDYVGLLGHLPVVFARWLRLRWRNPWQSPRRLVCSELVLRVCSECDVFSELDPEDATPSDVLAAIRKAPREVVG